MGLLTSPAYSTVWRLSTGEHSWRWPSCWRQLRWLIGGHWWTRRDESSHSRSAAVGWFQLIYCHAFFIYMPFQLTYSHACMSTYEDSRTKRLLDNSRIRQLADWTSRGLVNSRTGQLANATGDFECLVFVLLAASARPRLVQSASWPVRELAIREFSSYPQNCQELYLKMISFLAEYTHTQKWPVDKEDNIIGCGACCAWWAVARPLFASKLISVPFQIELRFV